MNQNLVAAVLVAACAAGHSIGALLDRTAFANRRWYALAVALDPIASDLTRGFSRDTAACIDEICRLLWMAN